ncbi:MAG: class flavin-dependent oxidoreductase [Chloroflexi bacterium]|nr:class flavin-dependent oxidoreductase [Chloroflexota bacterium]
MSQDKTTFGWVICPSTAAAHLPGRRDPLAAGEALVAADRAFIEALPPAFTTLWVEDHFQWNDAPTLEAFVTMTHFAALYPAFNMGSIVLGNSYRNPALTAKMAATLQLLTGGRFILGIGAGWKQDEYDAYGYPFPSAGVRIDQLDEACQIIKAMFEQSPATFEGQYYSVKNAYCEPRPSPRIPLLIGGSGERKTLRVVARHADMWNGAFRTSEQFAHKQAVLAQHCKDIGRDPAEIVHTYYGFVDLSDEQEDARREGSDMHILAGSSAQVASELRALIGLGVRHVMLRFLDFPATVGLERFTKEVLPALQA